MTRRSRERLQDCTQAEGNMPLVYFRVADVRRVSHLKLFFLFFRIQRIIPFTNLHEILQLQHMPKYNKLNKQTRDGY